MSGLKQLFLKSPFIIKRLMINIEAYRRDYYRRYGAYRVEKERIDFKYEMESGDYSRQKLLIDKLIKSATINIPAYEGKDYNDISDFPIISKLNLINNVDKYLSKAVDKRKCLKGHTSGSTGTPLTFYKHREAEMYNHLYYDLFIEYIGCSREDIKARISGVNVIPFDRKKSPFWIYIDKYKQLQLSSYHINLESVNNYCKAMIKYKVVYGTGYPSSWFFLAENLKKLDINPPKMKAIVTDSEGLSEEQKNIIESVFKCRVYATYGLSETGQFAIQCNSGNYHIVPNLAYVEVLNNNKYSTEDGVGEIVVTTLATDKTPLIRYRTGDLGQLGKGVCGCGMITQYLTKIIGRIDDYILYKGKKIGRLDHIFKSSKGIVASQLIQESPDKLMIHVIADKNFSADLMRDVIKGAKPYLGDMNISWKLVSDLERNKNGKIKYVIRRF